MLDLAYEEDSRAEVDMNVVKTSDGRFIEVQGTAETKPFDRAGLDALLALADSGIRQLIEKQREVVGKILKLPTEGNEEVAGNGRRDIERSAVRHRHLRVSTSAP